MTGTPQRARRGGLLRRFVAVGALALAAAAGPAAALIWTPPVADPLAACTGGEEEDVFTTTCTPFLVPNSSGPFTSIPGNPDLAEIDGVPCTGRDSGSCIGLAENAADAGPPAVPRVTISASP